MSKHNYNANELSKQTVLGNVSAAGSWVVLEDRKTQAYFY